MSDRISADEARERHVTTRCRRMNEHLYPKVGDPLPFPCSSCYSIESVWRRIPWEPESRKPAPDLAATVERLKADIQRLRAALEDREGVGAAAKAGEAKRPTCNGPGPLSVEGDTSE